MMRSLQHSPETLPADPCRIILRPPSVKFIKKKRERRKRPWTVGVDIVFVRHVPSLIHLCHESNARLARLTSRMHSIHPLIARFRSSSAVLSKRGKKKSQTRTLARPSHPFPPLLDTCWQIVSSLLSIHRGMHHRDDADEGHAHALCNPSEQCKQSMHRSRFIRIQTVPFWFLNYRSPMIDRSQRFSSDAGT